jgi:hypothetical protein
VSLRLSICRSAAGGQAGLPDEGGDGKSRPLGRIWMSRAAGT